MFAGKAGTGETGEEQMETWWRLQSLVEPWVRKEDGFQGALRQQESGARGKEQGGVVLSKGRSWCEGQQ